MIELVPYDSTWPDRFAREASLLRGVCGAAAIRIDHVGSTSIRGIAAKPVIDVQITAVALSPLADWVERLALLDYAHHASEDDGEYPFFHKPAAWPHVYHVHLCEPTSAVGRATLALRDYLRDQPELREAYADEKRRLAAEHVGDTAERREAYARGKSPFLEPLIERALALGYPRTRRITLWQREPDSAKATAPSVSSWTVARRGRSRGLMPSASPTKRERLKTASRDSAGE